MRRGQESLSLPVVGLIEYFPVGVSVCDRVHVCVLEYTFMRQDYRGWRVVRMSGLVNEGVNDRMNGTARYPIPCKTHQVFFLILIFQLMSGICHCVMRLIKVERIRCSS